MKKIVFSLYVFLFCLGANTITSFAQDKLYPNEFPLSEVKIIDEKFKHACDLNIDVLLQYDVDRLLAPFVREAGLPEKAKPYGNWESDGLDGHIGGHYLTAMAIHYATSGNKECKKRMDYMVSELKRCQNNSQHGKGYIGGFPVVKRVNGTPKNLWEELKKGNTGIVWNYWVPWYNIHKTFAGLRDAWVYGGNEDAKAIFLDFCDWGIDLISHLNDAQMEAMLANEFGGMNEVYADAYQITGKEKYLNTAKRFAHEQIFNSMKIKVDNLDNRHANTQVPKAVGYQRVAELNPSTASDYNDYITASRFFWETVVYNRSLAFGGNSRSEHFPPADKCLDYTEDRQGPETCNTNNMLKLTEGLFRMDPRAEYADYFERALYNHILSSQHPEHGGYVYFTPARPSHYRVYSAPEKGMWCCVGTGMENHGKYGQFIYTHTGDSLYVNLFVASELNWKEKGITLKQETKFPAEEGSRLTINVSSPTKLKLLVRYPKWVSFGEMQVNVNGKNYAQGASPQSYVVIDRTWNNGDVIEIKTPMKVTLEELPNVSKYVAIMRGPILLGAKTDTHNMPFLIAGDGRWEHIAGGSIVSVFDAPYIIGERNEILKKLNNMKAVEGKPFTYTAPDLFIQDKYKNLVFEPFYQIHDSRYMMYWLSMTEPEFADFVHEMGAEEREKLLLDQRTVDYVATGEQQPEADHYMAISNSNTGTHEKVTWRDARDGGYIQYTLSTKQLDNLSLMLRFWGNENGAREFDIYVDGTKIATENIVGKWNVNKFVNVEYKIPENLLKGKNQIVVKLQSKPGNIVGGLFYVRLLKPASSIAQIQSPNRPVVQTKFTADPAPLVHNGTVYLYTGHDEDDAPPGQSRFLMKEWLLYSSTDMVNWTDHGAVASLKDFEWTRDKENGAWASHCIERNGKFYFYGSTPGGSGIGVLVADSPFGPFKDPIGKPLIKNSHEDIDPAVFIDDDGQAYIYWGNPNLWYAKLNEDMISISGEIIKDSLIRKTRGVPDPYHFQEGPWTYKRNEHYYMAYASTCCPEGIGYSMGASATGPWEFKGYIMKPDKRATGNHPGIIDFKGKSYVFGFNFWLNFQVTDKHHERRSVYAAEITFNPDGTIQELPWWEESAPVQPVGTLDPYKRVEAETIAWSEGLKTQKDKKKGIYVSSIHNGDYIQLKSVDFKKGAKTFKIDAASLSSGGQIEIRLDGLDGTLLGVCEIKNTGGWNVWKTFRTDVKKVEGVHDLFFIFKGGENELFNLDHWKFDK